MAIIPGRRQITPGCGIHELTAVPGIGGKRREAPHTQPTEHHLHSIGPSAGCRGGRLVTRHAVVGSLAGQWNAVGERERRVGVALVKALDREPGPSVEVILHPQSRLVGSDIAQPRAVDQHLVLLESQGRIGRQLVIAPQTAVHIEIARYIVGEGEPGRELLERVVGEP